MSEVKLWQGLLDLPSYPLGHDDPYPPFQRTGNGWIYPYSMQDELLDERQEQTYPGVFMENEYLKLCILPTLGGRLYSVLDKTTGEEVFYRNRVFKPQLVALRGAWISGGIEFNFPQGHTVSTIAPVKCIMRQNDDGSATVTVGDVDRVTRMCWDVSLTLRPGEAAFRVGIRLENRTYLPHRYYFWSNAAVPAMPRMQFIYPMAQATTGRSTVAFPIHEDRDLSWYTNHPRAVDLFAKDPYDDYFGCYDHDADRGVVNVKDRHIAWGQKFFTWGTAGSGQIWESLLTDEDGPYCEIQSGRFATQSIHRMLAPQNVEAWQETWWPLKRMGGFCYANELLVLQLERRDDGLRVALNASRAVEEAELSVRKTDQVLGSTRLSLSPESPFSRIIPLQRDAMEGDLRILVTQNGSILLDYQEAAHAPTESGTTPQSETVETLCLQALRQEEENQPEAAAELYREAFKLDPGATHPHCGLAVLALKAGLLGEAETHLNALLERDPEHPEGHWYLGLLLRWRGDLEAAVPHFHRLERSPGYAHLGLLALGELAVQQHRWAEAAHHLGNAFQHSMRSSRTIAWMALTLRHQDQSEAALDIIESALDQHPLDLLLHADQCFASAGTNQGEEILHHFRTLMRGDPQAYLEVAMDYIGVGAWEEASDVLGVAIDEAPDEQSAYPMLHYTLGFCEGQLGNAEQMHAHYRLGALVSHRYVFPHRDEMLCILEDVLTHSPEDARAHYYLGNLHMARGRVDEAIQHWQHSVELDLTLTEAHRNLGLVLGRRDPAAGLEHYQSAIADAPTSYRLYLEWEKSSSTAGKSPQERLDFIEAADPEVTGRSEIMVRRIALLNELERFADAIQLLEAHTFRPWEGARGMRRLYVQAHLGRGRQHFERAEHADALEHFQAALEYPPNLGVGKPDSPDHTEILDWIQRAKQVSR